MHLDSSDEPWKDGLPPVQKFGSCAKSSCARAPRVRMKIHVTAPVVRVLTRVSGQLTWRYGYERMHKSLARKYAYAELMGPNGPVLSKNVILGLVLFGPKCTYPEHSHDGISESYICLSGSVSDSNYSVFTPGSLFFNPPEKAHRMTTGDFEPTLLAYAWTGTPEKLANQRMSFAGRKS